MVIIALSDQMSWELPQSWDSLYMVHTGKYRNTLGFYSFQHNPLRLCSQYRSDPERVSSDADQTEPYAHKKHPSLWSPQAWEAQAISFSLQPLPTPWLPVCKLPGHREKLLQTPCFCFPFLFHNSCLVMLWSQRNEQAESLAEHRGPAVCIVRHG